MKMAYHTHNQALKKFKAAKTAYKKELIAYEYFKNEAELVNQEMKDKLGEVEP